MLGPVILTAVGYLLAAAHGRRCDRRSRRWPLRRSACFLGGLALLVVDVGAVGAAGDTRVSMHTLEHMVMWVAVAPLIAAGAPMRLVLFGLPSARPAVRALLRSRLLRLVSTPVGSVSQFSLVLVVAHIPAVYAFTLRNEYAHELEHVVFLTSALLYWAPLLGVDPVPHRAGPRGQRCCAVACATVMGTLAVWLAVASPAWYAHAAGTAGRSGFADLQLAAVIMALGCLPGIALQALALMARRRPLRA